MPNRSAVLSDPIATPDALNPIAIHPGWLHRDSTIARIPNQADELRFDAVRDLLQASFALERAAVDILADLGLTAGAFFALLELAEAGDAGIAPSALARRICVARRTATLYVDILARQGWVERRNHPEDRRMVLAYLTPSGRSMVQSIQATRQEALGALLDGLTEAQLQQLRSIVSGLKLVGPEAHIGAALIAD